MPVLRDIALEGLDAILLAPGGWGAGNTVKMLFSISPLEGLDTVKLRLLGRVGRGDFVVVGGVGKIVWRKGGALLTRAGRALIRRVSKLSQREGVEVKSVGRAPIRELALFGRLR